MSSSLTSTGVADSSSPEYYYAVFNLPTTASGEEIRDKYRQLSLIFHPDKQQDERLKEAATQKFLEIQKAYEVLSDTTLRRAYDLYGTQGLALVQKSELDSLLLNDYQIELARRKAHHDYTRIQQVTQSVARTRIAVDATSLTDELEDNLTPFQEAWLRLSSIQMASMSVRNSFTKSFGSHTTVVCSPTVYVGLRKSTMWRRRAAVGTSFSGLLTHQLSPQWSLFAETDFLKAPSLRLGTSYADGDNEFSIETDLRPVLSMVTFGVLALESPEALSLMPPVSVSYGRRLFPNSQGLASISVSTASNIPALSIAFTTGKSAWDEDDVEDDTPTSKAAQLPSMNGFSSWRVWWTTGVQLQQLLPIPFASFGIAFGELGIRLYGSLELASTVPRFTFGAVWNAAQDEASGPHSLSAQAAISLSEISLKLKVIYYNQIIQVPITLSDDFDGSVAFWTTVVPSTFVTLAYCFLIRPQQRRRRMEFFRQARRELREVKADRLRSVEETLSLLRDAARRHMRAEASVDGLIITDAQYGPAERDEAARGLDIDVTVPLQVLVNNSQLHIPGRRSKAALPGFYDPAPSIAKSLRVHYTFRGRPHYTETRDHLPVVLPLEDHLVL